MSSEKVNRPLVAISWMLLTGLLFVGVTAIVKHVGTDLPPAQSAFLRYVTGLVFVIPLIKLIKKANLSRNELTLFAWRGLAHSIGVILWFYAMAILPMAEVTAMGYLSPIYVTIGAALFLGERIAALRILAIFAAILGVLIILRPGFREISFGHISMLLNGILFALSYLIAKVMADKVEPLVVVGMLSIFVTIGLAPWAFWVWVTPTLSQLGWTFLLAIFATAGHYTMTLALRAAPISVTQPITFLQLVWSVLMGVLVFNEGFDKWVIIGALIIVFSISFIMWREEHVRRKKITPSYPANKL
ncbi:MAG: DMT family transporter [Paracoccaceae bacterium]|nr:EamA family transporter [Paracoccaceae bacterium]|tara:strand:+ start:155 stop:1060 length:906 start_codon:yes stop_codon:yes gene_type:complete